ncbi:hypothetical protein A5757_20370 [Mycobacterium sp. 852013-51886_SCH5428379]|nr:hypothetical protein A5757_20370 [Mycobacterium sp. 852013-51886_SCH5428379]
MLTTRDLGVVAEVADREIARVCAVDGVSLRLHEGETLGLVGESGCGKSTLCRLILQLLTPTSGSVRLAGDELVGRSRRELRPVRRHIHAGASARSSAIR